jgi:hypothetical protein
MSKQITPKHFVEGEDVTWELSPYHQGMGIIRGRVQGMPNLDVEETWWVVELRDPNKIGNYEYSCIVLPSYRLEAIPR